MKVITEKITRQKNPISRLTSKNRKSQKSTFSGECLISEKRREIVDFYSLLKTSKLKMPNF